MHNESSTLYNECRLIGMNVGISKLMSLCRSDVVISNKLHVGSGTMLTYTTLHFYEIRARNSPPYLTRTLLLSPTPLSVEEDGLKHGALVNFNISGCNT